MPYHPGTMPLVGRLHTVAAELAEIAYLNRPLIDSPEAGAEIIAPLLEGLDREACVSLLLDTKHRVLDVELVSLGAAANTFMSPREVYRRALIEGATAILVAHNHPSGSPDPSEDDKRITHRLVRAGEVLGVDLIDHLVFGAGSWVSLARKGVV